MAELRVGRIAVVVVVAAALGWGDVSRGARSKVQLTLPAWEESDAAEYAEPGSYFLGGGLLPGFGDEDGDAEELFLPAYAGVDEGVTYGPEEEWMELVGTEAGPVFGPDPEPIEIGVGIEDEMDLVGTAAGPMFGPEPERVVLFVGVDEGVSYGPLAAWGIDEGMRFGPGERPLFAGVDEGSVYGPEPEPWSQSEGSGLEDIPLPPSRVPVPEEYLEAYFAAKPTEGLVDPQLMFTEFLRYDIEDFLLYHEDESPYRIHMLMFEGKQELPDEVDLAALHGEWFGDEPVVLMAYFMGEPERAIVEYGSLARKGVSAAFLKEATVRCVEQGHVVHNEFNQFERFAMELSVQLYWLERELGLEPPAVSRAAEMAAAAEAEAAEREEPKGAKAILAARLARVSGTVWLAIWFGVSTVIGVGIFLWLRQRARDRTGYWFPDYETETRLGGAHCGGGHGVFFFGGAGRG
ncbi:MAG: hypothetical protein AAF591_09720 [Verrucomicrobiota bacterium]